MPQVDTDDTGRGRWLLPSLFWAGVGLAPLAVLLLLLGGSAPVRVGAILGILAVVLIGLSVALRPDISTVRLRIEEGVLEELDALRAEMRGEIAEAARVTHQMVGERLGVMHQQLVDAVRAAAPPPASAAPAMAGQPLAGQALAGQPVAGQPVAGQAMGGPAMARQPMGGPAMAGQPMGGQAMAGQRMGAPAMGGAGMAAPAMAAAVPDGMPVAGQPAPGAMAGSGRMPAPGGTAGAGPMGGTAGATAAHRPTPVAMGNGEPVRGSLYRPVSAAPQSPDPGRVRAPATGRAAAGRYHHTETVQVTTRSTYVDDRSYHGDQDRGYHGGYADQGWSAPRAEPVPGQESWTDQKMRERYGGRRPQPHDRFHADPADDQPPAEETAPVYPVQASRSRSQSRPWSAPPADAGDRGAPPEPGRRRADPYPGGWEDAGAGTPGAGSGGGRHSGAEPEWGNGGRRRGPDGGGGWDNEDRPWSRRRPEPDYARPPEPDFAPPTEPVHHRPAAPDYSRPALPPGGQQPSWNDSWDESVSAGRSGSASGRGAPAYQRRLDFELSDERWR